MRMILGADAAERELSRGRGLDLASAETKSDRVFGEPLTALETVARIVREVREGGDDAVRRIALSIEGSAPAALEAPRDAIESAAAALDPRVADALELAADRIRRYHEAAMPRDWMDFAAGYGAMVKPCERAGVYVPGGSAPLPSTALMTAIPARVAGVSEVFMCAPPAGDGGGLPDPITLAAAKIAGVDRVFAIGGAQAVAAMAYGTETVPKADIVCGPGNIFVTLAKKLVYGDVGVDGLYGPTETLIIADAAANPTLCAADLLAQAEHDPLATPVLVCLSQSLADRVSDEVEARLSRLSRQSVARASADARGIIAVVENLNEAVRVANRFAPEHICLAVEDPWRWVGEIRNAGIVFLGEFSHEVLGDYVAGPSHVMPTSGAARFGSGVGVHSFLKTIPIVALGDDRSAELSESAALIARAEGLTAHAEAAEIRCELRR